MLPTEDFLRVVRDAPLVSIDLIVRDPQGSVLLGMRVNRPAQGTWFVPGGIVRKNESLDLAFRRISEAELGFAPDRKYAPLIGVYEHMYPDNFAGESGFGTHYVVLAHELPVPARPARLPNQQHRQYRWVTLKELATDPDVHSYSRAYRAAFDRIE